MTLHLTSQWFIKSGCEQEALMAVAQLAQKVEAQEPGTLSYLVHVPSANSSLQSLPPADPLGLLFFEIYRDTNAFMDHLHGPLFKRFLEDHGKCFLSANGSPFMTVQFLALHAGFVRDSKMSSRADPGVIVPANQHPCVMFEVIAQDQARAQAFYSEVFGWSYQTGTGGFAYVHLPSKIQSLLGGIGQANSSVPGFEPGHNFYILVEDMDAAIARAEAAGGKLHMEVANVDGYTFAMVEDPEGNPIGLIKPFDSPTQ